MPLIGPRHISPSRSPSRQSLPVQVIDDHLGSCHLAGTELCVPKRISSFSEASHIKALRDNEATADLLKFLDKVMNNEATLADVTDSLRDWLGKNQALSLLKIQL